VPDFYCKNENIKIYNDKIKEVCEKNDIHFIEMLDLLNNEDLKDGLHPSSEGHKKMFLRIKDYLKENSII
jgi:lysophospholipase L1-like esterase